MADPLDDLTRAGVAIWLDDLSRARLADGSLTRLVRDSHVVGVTTNPTIFHKAIVGSDYYDRQIRELAVQGVDVEDVLRRITTRDVSWACDLLRPAHDATDGVDGRVSIEVDPRLAHDTDRTVAQARHLWWSVDRPNLFIKIPATFTSARWHALARAGARPQRPLWASTGVKDPAYTDTRYVLERVTDGVVTTMPEATLRAVADHGVVRGDTIRGSYDDAAAVMATLEDVGIDYDDVVEKLARDGLTTFQASWAALTETLEQMLAAAKSSGGDEDDPT
jgi:transaldolase